MPELGWLLDRVVNLLFEFKIGSILYLPSFYFCEISRFL